MTPIAAILIRNAQGKLFVAKRSPTKRIYPGLFGIGAGGHIEQGETPVAGAARELFEETGITTPVTPLFSFDFHDGERHQIDYWFETHYDGDIPNHQEEWEWSGWMTVDEVDKLAQAGKLCPDTALFYERYRRRAV
jgi:8-oxo-dGTP pyrophosphatase MutT (NUDIX family)